MASDLIPAIESFLDAQRIDRGASDYTISSYKSDLSQFAQSMKGTTTLSQIRPRHLDDFILSLSDQKPATIARKISSIRQFFKFCCIEGKLKQNPAEKLRSPKLGQRLPKSLSLKETQALLDAAIQGLPYAKQSKKALQARDRAIVFLLYATGVRISELVGLESGDIDTQMSYARVRGKGSKERIAPFAVAAGEHLLEYLNRHRSTLKPMSAHLFLNSRGFALTRQSAWKILKGLALQAGLASTLSPHKLRHSFATHLLQSGINLRSLQMLLGHSDLSTTQIYTHLSPQHLKDAHKKFHPRGE